MQMYIKYTPIATVVSLIAAAQVHASGGVAGDNGKSFLNGVELTLIQDFYLGFPGSTGLTDNGGNGLPVGSKDFSIAWSVIVGADGLGGFASADGGSGSGGHSGAVAAGGISQGGAGGNVFSAGDTSASGGAGGGAANNTINIASSTLNGAKGGSGGLVSRNGGQEQEAAVRCTGD